ncbi:39S mitochondrial ribosomal protein L46-domain-containing protein, partial [Mycena pura]
KPILHTAVILNRAPLLTPSPTPFERAFYAYQQRIRRALHNPFPSEFYFKQGSLLEAQFNAEERFRERVAWGPTFAKEDDVSPERKAAEQAAIDQMALQERSDDRLMPRVHPSDTARDYHSLDRKGRRNIYLLIRRMEDGERIWEFPRGLAGLGELLHQAAQRELHAQCGNRMDTWIVTRKPIGMYKPPIEDLHSSPQNITFFFKAQIMAGQVRPGKSVEDFAWVTKQEIEKRVNKDYWKGIQDILSDH